MPDQKVQNDSGIPGNGDEAFPSRQSLSEQNNVVRRKVVELFEGDRATAELWLSSPIRALGNQAPVTLMGSEAGLLKVWNLIKKWEEGGVS